MAPPWDVVVIGGGNAALVSALTASGRGAPWRGATLADGVRVAEWTTGARAADRLAPP
jgi:succinate dehydrogenase/fumarate reductase flavoprotein subunit